VVKKSVTLSISPSWLLTPSFAHLREPSRLKLRLPPTRYRHIRRATAPYATADPDLPNLPFSLHLIFMSTTEILAQLPRLSPEERDLVRSRLDDIDSSAPLTPAEKQLVDQRVAAYRQNPDAGVSWAVAEAEIRKQIGL
jgi:hypothetical protein